MDVSYIGMYWIDPNLGSTGDAFQVSCNFTVRENCIKSPKIKRTNQDENVSKTIKWIYKRQKSPDV